MSQRKSRKPAAANGTATNGTALALPTITRAQAQELIKGRAVELFHDARARQQEGIQRFEAEYGRADRIDATLLRELQHLQMRFAAIAARQQRASYSQEPKVNKFVKQLGEIIGDVTVHLATDNALELFAPIEEHAFIGYGRDNGAVGRKGYDPSVLEGYNVIDEPKPTSTPPSANDDGEDVCLHRSIEAYEEDPRQGACVDCGDEFELPATVSVDSAEASNAA